MISAIISCMNRTDRLEKMLPTWAKIDLIKDIRIVDWNSSIPIANSDIIKNYIKEFPKIKIIRVDQQKYYHLGISNNIAYQFTDPKNKILLKLDVDYMNINDSWLDSLVYENARLKKYFIIGSYRFYKSSSGFLLVNKHDFIKVKGYNENLLSAWGYDDIDLQKRLTDLYPNDANYKKIEFFNIKNYIHHIPHEDDLRVANYPIKIKSDFLNKDFADNSKEWNFKNFKITEASESCIKIILEDKIHE